MQNRRTPGTASEIANHVRETGTDVVLWRPDILVAPGAILASLGEAAHVSAARHGGEGRGRTERERVSAALDLYRAGLGLDPLLEPPSIPRAGLITERGWR
ncbi:MAG: hypothetical protein HYU51_08150 [Candidatus Rokubacteria bacterium]|nr:hypothetical protein [Candidatus Rokubacteria bacterium]